MSKNKETIDKIREFADPIIKRQGGTDVQKFNLKDIAIEDGMKFDGISLNEKSMRTVLNALHVKPHFLDFKDKLSTQDWALIGKKLKEARGDMDLYGNVFSPNDKTKREITWLTPKNNKKKLSDADTTSPAIIDKIELALSSSDVNFSVAGLDFNPKNNLFSINLMNEDFTFSPFADDVWKKGESFKFNSLGFKNMPMVERLSCSNGMTTQNFGFASHIGQTRFNDKKIEGEIRKSLLKDNNKVHTMVDGMLQRLKKTNISVGEFLAWKRHLSGLDDGYDVIADKYLNEAPLLAAYKTDIIKQSDVWKRTADSGINAYNFLNLITWIASHADDSGVSKDHGADLKVSAGNYLFKKSFDLEKIADKVDIDYPVLEEML